MRLTNSPSEVRPPYGCAICRGDVGLVDTLTDCDDHFDMSKNGALYLCTPCISLAAEEVGFVQKAIFDATFNELDALRMENDILREKHLEDVDAVIAAVRERKLAKAVDA